MNKDAFSSLGENKNNFKKTENIQSKHILCGEIEHPYISFVIPTCGRVNTLQEAIESIIEQDNCGMSYEIVVVDNSCDFTDDNPTFQYLCSLSNCCIEYYQNEKNLGFDGNSNRGVLLSRGEWISFLHDDDLITSDYFKEIDYYLKSYRNIGYIKTSTIEFADTSEKTEKNKVYQTSSRLRKRMWRKLEKITRTDALIMGYSLTCIPSCGTLVNRKAFIEVGGFNDELYPSSDAYPGYQMIGKYGVFKTTEPLGYYRWSLNASLKKETILGFIEANLYFRNYIYTQSIRSRLFGMCFGEAYYSKNVDEWMEKAKKHGVDIRVDELERIHPYKACKIRRKMIIAIQSFHARFKKVWNFVIGK